MAHNVTGTSPEQASPFSANDGVLVRRFEAAMADFRSGRLNEARTELEDLTQRYPNNAASFHFLGFI